MFQPAQKPVSIEEGCKKCGGMLLRDDDTEFSGEYEYVCVSGHRTEFTMKHYSAYSKVGDSTYGFIKEEKVKWVNRQRVN